MEYYPDNSLTSFRTHFDSPLLLPEAYEAALTEIILPTEWSNVHDDDMIIVVPLRTRRALLEAEDFLKGKKLSERRDPAVDWKEMKDTIGLNNLFFSDENPRPLSEKEESYVTVEEMSDTSEEQRLKPETKRFKREVDLRQTNAVYKQFLSPSVKKKAISDQAEHMIKKLEKDEEVGTLMPNIFKIAPIFTGSNHTLVQRLSHTLRDARLERASFLLEPTAIFSYDSETRRVSIKPPRHCAVLLTQHLATVLGFGEKTSFTSPTTGAYMMDVFGDVHSVYVYTDMIQERRVGDMQVPLLRCVAVDRGGKRRGGVQAFSFHHLDYFPLKSKKVTEVGIYLRDRSGHAIPFSRGEVTVTLHLRPIER